MSQMKSTSSFHLRNVLFLLLPGLIWFLNSHSAYSQENPATSQNSKRLMQAEQASGPYQPSPRESHPRSPAYKFLSADFTIVQVNVDDNGDNIVNDAANEPSITFNPNNPDEIAIGWRQFDNIYDNFRQAGNAYSTDGGQSWTFPGVIDEGVFRSDPVLRSDGQGNFFYNSLTTDNTNYWTNTYRSSNGGQQWQMGTLSQGGDKQWIAIDRGEGVGGGNIYEFWNGAYSLCTPNNFTRSTDGNQSYEDCSWVPGDPYWGTMMVAPDGTLYACGYTWGGFWVGKSTSAQDPAGDMNWDITITVNMGGEIIGFGGDNCPNPDGLLGQTIIAMDSSGGPGNGNIYLLCSVLPTFNSDPCDVMFIRSTDGGINWSSPVRVNDDASNTAYQWFGTMSVAPDGRIDVIWLDTRNGLGSVTSSLYYSYSLDQGVTWEPNQKLSDAFDPHVGWPQQNKMGDYFDMYSDETGAHLAWAATFNGEQDVYYSLIKPSYVGLAGHKTVKVAELWSNPNPFKGQTDIHYRLAESGPVTLKLYNSSGIEIKILVNEDQSKGNHDLIFNQDGLEAGIYYYRLQSEFETGTNRFIILK
jgi:hypothetical protein